MATGPTHDVIVVGAGPAGSAAARTARAAGLSVALIDKARFPRDKLCGGAVSGRGLRHLREVFGAGLPADMALTVRRVRIMAGERLLGELDHVTPLHLVMRHVFDAFLRDQAVAAGAEDFCGQRILSLDLDAGQVELAAGTLRGRVVIGADGAASPVARALHGRAFHPDRIGFALEVEVPQADPDPVLELDMTAAEWGYGWAFPKRGGLTLGVGGVHRRNPDLRARLDMLLARHGIDPGASRPKGAFLPFGDPRPAPGRGAVLLAGDAAGMVDPLTGEGIAWAMRSGQLAALAAAEALASDRPHAAFAAYAQALRPVQRELARARLARSLVYHPLLQRRGLDLIARQPGLQRRYMQLLAGEMDYADIRPSRLPKLALALMR